MIYNYPNSYYDSANDKKIYKILQGSFTQDGAVMSTDLRSKVMSPYLQDEVIYKINMIV